MTRIRWGRVIGLAFALEAALFATLLPIQPLLSVRNWIVAVTIACAVLAYVAGRLAGRRLPPRAAVLHGLLVGALATIIYLVICAAGPGGIPAAAAFYGIVLYVVLNALRIAGCTVGAMHQSIGAS